MHTVVLSDMHLSEAHDPEPRRPFWMAYKRRDHFIDQDFARLLGHLDRTVDDRVEVILNGDIFDFDSVLALPPAAALGPEQRVDWLARLRGLASEEWMSRFKMERILADHPDWLAALKSFLDSRPRDRSHRVVFVLGNHDLELTWPSVQGLVRRALGIDDGDERVVFCEWFYLSQGDTFVSHGHQYDANCVGDPIDPLISVHGRPRVRVPFGDTAGRYLLNGMGYFNPHATSNFIMSASAYFRFFLRYIVRDQPLLLWTWFWSAVATMLVSMRDHLRPAMRDPLTVEEKVAAIARRANATPAMVRQLRALEVPSVCSRPLAMMRVLWLDRAILLLAMLFGAWQLVLHVNIAVPVSPLWALVPLALLVPPYIAYANKQKSTVFAEPLLDEQQAKLLCEITGAHRVVFGHTHAPENRRVGPIDFYNAGFWSPAFAEPECRQRVGTQSFVWIDGARAATLYEWPPHAEAPRPLLEPLEDPSGERPLTDSGTQPRADEGDTRLSA